MTRFRIFFAWALFGQRERRGRSLYKVVQRRVCRVFEESVKTFLFFFFFFLPQQHQSLDFKGDRKRYFLLLLLMFPLTGGLIMHRFPFYPAHCVPLSVLSTVSDLKIKAGRRQRCCSLSAGEAFCFSIPPSCRIVGDDQQVSRNSQPVNSSRNGK